MSQVLVFWVITIGIYVFMDAGGAIGGILAAVLFGLVAIWMWIIGAIKGIEEYWQGKVPNWMIWLADKPNEKPWVPLLHHPKSFKFVSIAAVIAGASIGFIKADYSYAIGFLVFIILVWSMGVWLVERHFRRNYTPRQMH